MGGEADNLFDFRCLEDSANSLRMQVGEGWLNQILFLKVPSVQDEGFEGLEKLDLEHREIIVVGNELLKGLFNFCRPC